MTFVQGVYEVAIPVADLDRAAAFYGEVLGLTDGLRDEPRRWLFLRAGGGAGMIVLQEGEVGPARHFAFTIGAADVERAAAALRARGVSVDGPHVHAWIPATSLYFRDPDGHDVEFCAPGPPA
jgi:lactoylglutathione lyase